MQFDESLKGALADARALGFLGPGELDEHLVSATAFLRGLQHANASGPGLDLGSGGGVPGLVLATVTPWQWTLLDSSRRRTSFLQAAAARLDLAARVVVRRARAEEAGRDPALRGRFGVVTARSFGPPSATAECASPFLAVGGVLVVAEPPSDRLRWDPEGLARLGLAPLEPLVSPRRMALLRQVSLCPETYPRRWQQQISKPLF